MGYDDFKMMMDEKTSKKIGKWAAIGAKNPSKLSPAQVQAVCASALTQRPDRVEAEPSDNKTAVLEQVALITEAAAEIKRITTGEG